MGSPSAPTYAGNMLQTDLPTSILSSLRSAGITHRGGTPEAVTLAGYQDEPQRVAVLFGLPDGGAILRSTTLDDAIYQAEHLMAIRNARKQS